MMSISLHLLGTPLVERGVRFALRSLRFLSRRLAAWQQTLAEQRPDHSTHNQAVVESTIRYDMAAAPDEAYYQSQYWYWIDRAVDSHDIKCGATCLDLGCGQGRMTIPLAKKVKDGRVLGVDLSETAIEAAKRYAAQQGITNIEYRVGSILDTLKGCDCDSIDVALMTEVTFFNPGWRVEVEEIKRVLKPGGLACISFRPQYFYALWIVNHRLWDRVDMVLARRLGQLGGGPPVFTWQKSAEIHEMVTKDLDMELVRLVGIGCCSGIERDPHARLARPSQLDHDEIEQLLRLELALGPELPDTGRYMLAIARKKTPNEHYTVS